jgi:membrane dipeptidase
MFRTNRFRIIAVCLVVLLGLGWAVLPGLVESLLNRVSAHAPYVIRHEVQDRHDRLLIADWHADSLLWNRDLLAWGRRGQVDVPRLIAGNVGVQMFTLVTMAPTEQNYERNELNYDTITMLAVAQRWPLRTLGSAAERALHQIERFHGFAAEAPERLRFVGDATTLRALLAERDAGSSVVAGLLGIEGAHALDGELAGLDRLYDAGVRMVGLQHFFDNRLGGSLHGVSRAGLTEFGREVVRRAQAKHMIIDVAHSAPAVVDDVLEIATRPVVVSHTGLQGICPTARNLEDEQMKRIAAAGGLVAVGFWDGAVCDFTPEGIVRSLRYAIDLLGVDHVALGSDYDGSIEANFDVSEIAVLTQTMIDQGFSDIEIEQVTGENTRRFLLAELPQN